MTENTLTTHDVRQADRIVFECLDRWSDPVAWQQHLLKQMAELLKMRVGVYIELDTLEPDKIPEVLSAVEYGWEDLRQRKAFVGPNLSRPVPFSESPLDTRMRELLVGRDAIALTRSDVVTPKAWEAGDAYRHHYEPVGLYESVRSAHRLEPNNTVSAICFAGGCEPVPGARERQLLSFVHHEVAVAHRTRLSHWLHVTPMGLTPRQREVFHLLLTGKREQTIAKQLCRSHATISEHIRGIYRHFEVNSRGELLAYLLQRAPKIRSQALPPGVIK